MKEKHNQLVGYTFRGNIIEGRIQRGVCGGGGEALDGGQTVAAGSRRVTSQLAEFPMAVS